MEAKIRAVIRLLSCERAFSVDLLAIDLGLDGDFPFLFGPLVDAFYQDFWWLPHLVELSLTDIKIMYNNENLVLYSWKFSSAENFAPCSCRQNFYLAKVLS